MDNESKETNMEAIEPAAMTALLPNLSEDGGFILFYAMCQQYGWAGTVFTRGDAEQAWNAERDPDGIGPEQDMPDNVWDAILCSWAWRRGLPERLAEIGWDLVAEAAREAIEQTEAGNE